MLQVRVQTDAIAVASELAVLWQTADVGAVVSFVGLVREFNAGRAVLRMTLEHYPGMTERVLMNLVEMAAGRWALNRVTLIHRVGTLELQEPIVFIGVASTHRAAAFAACAFLIDELKIRAPFWKKEHTAIGAHWVAAPAISCEDKSC